MIIKRFNNILVFALTANLMFWQAAQANPTGATVVNGQVSFAQPNANTFSITNSPNAIINWQGFDIGAGELTQFLQQNAKSSVLNRVTSGNASTILGKLQSNGQVFLINPNGLVIGQGAVINTAGFVGSTLNITDQDFLNGRLHFEGQNAGNIDNQGFIRAGDGGDILLIAPNIENSGVIQVDGGNILLAAGESITISSLDDANISFEVQAADNSVTNLGEIIADNGAASLFAGTLTHSGSISANSISTDAAGNIRLVAQGTNLIDGNVVATNTDGVGGNIELLGEEVGLFGNATVDASGQFGGGQILVGGDYQGQGDVQTARASFVGEDVQIMADALEAGDGGKVIVWSNEATRMYGSIFATGGANSGNGGFIETSGGWFDLGTFVPDASAPNGQGGTWLIDPNNIDIINGTGVNIIGGPVFTSSGEPAQIDIAQIDAALEAGNNVVVQTGTAAPNLGAGNINWGAAVNLDLDDVPVQNATLTLSAHNDINIDGTITYQGTGAPGINLTLVADSDGDGTGSFTLGATGDLLLTFSGTVGALDISAGGDIVLDGNIDTNGGSVTLNTTNGSISQALSATTIANDLVVTVAGDMDFLGANSFTNLNVLQTSPGNINFFNSGNLSIDVINALGSSVTLNNTGTIDQTGAIGGIVADSLIVNGSSNIDLSNANNTVASLNVTTNTGSDVTFNNGGTNLMIDGITDISVGNLGTVTIVNGNDINQTAGSTHEIRANTLNVTAGGNVDLTNNFNTVTNLNAVTTAGGDFSITNNAALTTGAITVDGDAKIESQNLTIGGLFNSVGNTQLISTSGALLIQNSISSSASNVELIADDFTITNNVTAQNQVVVREYSAASGLEINDATPTSGFATLTTSDLGNLTGTNLGIVLGNDLAHTSTKNVQIVSDIDSSMINGTALTLDTTNNSTGTSAALINADIDFTSGNENLIFTGNGTASIQSSVAFGEVMVDTGNGNLSANVSQFNIIAVENHQVVVKTRNSDIIGNLSINSGTLAGSSVLFEGNDLSVQGALNISAFLDSAEVNFSGDVDINTTNAVSLFAGMSDDAFVKLVGGNIDINAGSTTLNGGDGMNAVAEIASTAGGSTQIDVSGEIMLNPGLGTDADAFIVGGGGQGAVTLDYATCQGCDTQLFSSPVGNGVTDTGVFGRTIIQNGVVTASASNTGILDPIPELDSLYNNFLAQYVKPVEEDDEDDLLVCR